METIIITCANYFDPLLPEEGGKTHAEVRRNFGTKNQPHWETIHYDDDEQAAAAWLESNQ